MGGEGQFETTIQCLLYRLLAVIHLAAILDGEECCVIGLNIRSYFRGLLKFICLFVISLKKKPLLQNQHPINEFSKIFDMTLTSILRCSRDEMMFCRCFAETAQ